MNSDQPKLPKIMYVIERPLYTVAPGGTNNPFHKPSQQADNFSGLFINVTGTANTSVVSPSASPDEYIYFIPESGPLPVVEMKREQMGKNLEQAEQLSPESQDGSQKT